jgi:hypothetical protein
LQLWIVPTGDNVPTDREQLTVATDNGQFHPGECVIVAEGLDKFTRGTFIDFPIEWLRSDEKQGHPR